MVNIIIWILFGSVIISALPLQLLGLPGTWLLVAGAVLFRMLMGPDLFGYNTVLTLAVMALLGEVLEFLAAVRGARSGPPVKGAVAASILGAIVGGILGAPLFFGLGAIPGMAAGAWSGVFIVALARHQTPGTAFITAYEAMVGRLKGTAFKIIVAAAMVAVLVTSLVM